MNALEETIYCLAKECKPEELGKALAVALNAIDSENETPKKFSVDVLVMILSHVEQENIDLILKKLDDGI